MKKVYLSLFTATCIAAVLYFVTVESSDPRKEYEKFLKEHPYMALLKAGGNSEEGESKKSDRPDLAFLQDYLRTMDPSLKEPTPISLSITPI